jgi:arginyl-tRNA synthetase
MACARAAGWITDDVQRRARDVRQRSGPDRKPLKTRAGKTVKLRELLDEAESRALKLMEERAKDNESDAGEAEWQTGGGTVRDRSVATGVCDDAAAEQWISERFGIPTEEVDLDAPLSSLASTLDSVERIMGLTDALDLSPAEVRKEIERSRTIIEHTTFRQLIQLLARMGMLPDALAGQPQRKLPMEECRDALEQSEGDPRSAAVRGFIAKRVGVASVKYADLRNDRTSDYVFTWDKMISFQGNTAPYMMYAYARIRSIYRKAAERIGASDVYGADVAVGVAEPAERALGLRLARLREAIDQVAADLTPHTLCTYLYELAGEFMRFYESCPVLTAPDDATRLSRLRLCDLTARTLKLGLGLLGIRVIERM